MKAKFINEKFYKGSDPIKDMGIGWDIHKYIKRQCKKYNLSEKEFYDIFNEYVQSDPGSIISILMSLLDNMPISFQQQYIDELFDIINYLNN